jgi:hypothetical protein
MTYATCTNPACERSGDDGLPFTVTIGRDAYGAYSDDISCPDCGEDGRFA